MGRVGWLGGVGGLVGCISEGLDKLTERRKEKSRVGNGVDLYVVNKDFSYRGFVLLNICIAEWTQKRRWVS